MHGANGFIEGINAQLYRETLLLEDLLPRISAADGLHISHLRRVMILSPFNGFRIFNGFHHPLQQVPVIPNPIAIAGRVLLRLQRERSAGGDHRFDYSCFGMNLDYQEEGIDYEVLDEHYEMMHDWEIAFDLEYPPQSMGPNGWAVPGQFPVHHHQGPPSATPSSPAYSPSSPAYAQSHTSAEHQPDDDDLGDEISAGSEAEGDAPAAPDGYIETSAGIEAEANAPAALEDDIDLSDDDSTGSHDYGAGLPYHIDSVVNHIVSYIGPSFPVTAIHVSKDSESLRNKLATMISRTGDEAAEEPSLAEKIYKSLEDEKLFQRLSKRCGKAKVMLLIEFSLSTANNCRTRVELASELATKAGIQNKDYMVTRNSAAFNETLLVYDATKKIETSVEEFPTRRSLLYSLIDPSRYVAMPNALHPTPPMPVTAPSIPSVVSSREQTVLEAAAAGLLKFAAPKRAHASSCSPCANKRTHPPDVGSERRGDPIGDGPRRAFVAFFIAAFMLVTSALLGIRVGEARKPGPLTYAHPCCGMDAWHHACPDDTLAWAADIDKVCRDTVLRQQKVTCCGNILHLNTSQLPDVRLDLYVIGTDCRPWTALGNQRGDDDPKSTAYWLHWRVIRGMAPSNRPRVVITENSTLLRGTDALKRAHAEARDLGYIPEEHYLDSRELNSIQQRKRLYCIYVSSPTFTRVGHVALPPKPRITCNVRSAMSTMVKDRLASSLTNAFQLQPLHETAPTAHFDRPSTPIRRP